jgi:hypothetical protein
MTSTAYSVGMSEANALNPFALALFMEAARRLRAKSAARFAKRQAYLGRPVPRSATDRRPDPGTLDNEPGLIDG